MIPNSIQDQELLSRYGRQVVKLYHSGIQPDVISRNLGLDIKTVKSIIAGEKNDANFADSYIRTIKKNSKYFRCALTNRLLKEAIIASDGHTYEKAAYEAKIAESNRSPITGELIKQEYLPIPMKDLSNRCRHFCIKNLEEIVTWMKIVTSHQNLLEAAVELLEVLDPDEDFACFINLLQVVNGTELEKLFKIMDESEKKNETKTENVDKWLRKIQTELVLKAEYRQAAFDVTFYLIRTKRQSEQTFENMLKLLQVKLSDKELKETLAVVSPNEFGENKCQIIIEALREPLKNDHAALADLENKLIESGFTEPSLRESYNTDSIMRENDQSEYTRHKSFNENYLSEQISYIDNRINILPKTENNSIFIEIIKPMLHVIRELAGTFLNDKAEKQYLESFNLKRLDEFDMKLNAMYSYLTNLKVIINKTNEGINFNPKDYTLIELDSSTKGIRKNFENELNQLFYESDYNPKEHEHKSFTHIDLNGADRGKCGSNTQYIEPTPNEDTPKDHNLQPIKAHKIANKQVTSGNAIDRGINFILNTPKESELFKTTL